MEKFGEITVPTIKERFIERLSGMIFSGQLKVGEKLPSEREMAAAMKVSKSIVHTGMEALAQMGLVRVKPQSGTYVADYMKEGNMDTLNAMVKYGGKNMDEQLRQIFLDLRMATEGLAFQRLAERRTEADMEALRREAAEIGSFMREQEEPELQQLAEMFFHFHRQIGIRSGCAMMPFLMNAIYDVAIDVWEDYLRVTDPEDALALLDLFLDRIEAGDGDGAVALLREGIETYNQRSRQGCPAV